MTTARTIIQDCLTFRLNRLSPGETADADTLDTCLRGLNSIADEWNGEKSFLFREILTKSSAITGATAVLGVDWTGLVPGDEILGATVQYNSTLDVPLVPLTMAQYADVAIKSITSIPSQYAYDGQATVYFYPQVNGLTVTLRTKQVVSDFADLDTDYTMPKGYKSALTDCLSEALAPTMNPGMLATCTTRAKAARNRIGVQAVNPAIIGGTAGAGPVVRIMRGY